MNMKDIKLFLIEQAKICKANNFGSRKALYNTIQYNAMMSCDALQSLT